jgi:hypothetical protein
MFKYLQGDDMNIATSVKLNIYDDLGGGNNSKIQGYTDRTGLRKSWDGERPYSVTQTALDFNKQEDVAKFNKARRGYDSAMADWAKIKKQIMDDKNKTLDAWMKIKPEVQQRYDAGVEAQKRADYKKWRTGR